jgi:hypothetical protein
MAEKKRETTKAGRVEIGFSGGQVVAARLEPKQLDDVRKALGKSEGWLSLESEDGELSIDVSEVVFVRLAASEHRIGFSGN